MKIWKTYRQGNKIRAWFKDKERKISDLAREMGNNESLLHNTITGRANNRRVLRKLLEIGVPEKYLDLPEDMKVKNEEAA